jgi:hypothetical protein
MAILDAGVYQDWIRAFDHWEQAERRYNAAAAFGNNALTEYLRRSLEAARQEYNAAIKAIKNA